MMNRAHLHLPCLLLALALASGCIRFSRPGENAPSDGPSASEPEAPKSDAERHFPKSYKLVREAEQALSEDPARTIELATKAYETLQEERTSEHVSLDRPYQQISNSAGVLSSLARKVDGPLEVIKFWGFRGWAPGRCQKVLPSLEEQCKQLGKDMIAEVPQLLTYKSFYSSYRFKTTVGGSSLSKASFLRDADKRVREADKTPLGGRFTPTSRKTVGDKVVLSVDGETNRSHITKCRDTGIDVRVGKVDFDVKRCHKKGFMSYAAHFRVELPARDVADLEPGDTIYVFFDPKDYIVSGNTRTIRNARFAFLERKGARQW